MQGSNKSTRNVPKNGDGTQQVRGDQDANWYGQSQEPQEEFIENGPSPGAPSSTKMSGSSEGEPTFSGSKQPGTPERAVERDPKKPTDIDNRH
jgi:hypothetical protein